MCTCVCVCVCLSSVACGVGLAQRKADVECDLATLVLPLTQPAVSPGIAVSAKRKKKDVRVPFGACTPLHPLYKLLWPSFLTEYPPHAENLVHSYGGAECIISNVRFGSARATENKSERSKPLPNVLHSAPPVTSTPSREMIDSIRLPLVISCSRQCARAKHSHYSRHTRITHESVSFPSPCTSPAESISTLGGASASSGCSCRSRVRSCSSGRSGVPVSI